MKIKEWIKKHKYILGFSFVIVCFSLFMTMLFHKDSDYFWHIKAGEYMFNNGILTKDIFSWFMNGKYWMSHEWAFDYLIYLLKYLFGSSHLFIYSFVCIVGLLLILFFSNKINYLKNIIFSLIWLVGFLIFCVFIQARPHMISFLFVALTIWFLYDLFINENSKKIYLLPIVTLLWANFHGGSSNLSYIFCLMFVIVGLFKFNFMKIEATRLSGKQIIKYLSVALVCALVICINPHGVKMLIYPYTNILDNVMIDFISEWQPTVLSNASHYPYFILVIFIVSVMLFSKEKIKFIDLALLGVSVFLGLKSIRFWSYTYILMNYVIFNYIPERKIDRGTTRVLLMLGAIFLCIFITNFSMLEKEYNKVTITKEMIETIKKESPERLFNMYDYGGELVYNDILVFVDGRADLYSKYNLDDYSNISMLNGDYVKLIEKYNFDYFLVAKKYPIGMYLQYSEDYDVILEEDEMILYKKKDSI